jgi:hypothetical protein
VLRSSIAAGTVALGFIPAAAQAWPIIECGNLSIDGIQNITTRNGSCSDARSFANKVSYLPQWRIGWITFPGWHTYKVNFHYQSYNGEPDARATRTNHVIHF